MKATLHCEPGGPSSTGGLNRSVSADPIRRFDMCRCFGSMKQLFQAAWHDRARQKFRNTDV